MKKREWQTRIPKSYWKWFEIAGISARARLVLIAIKTFADKDGGNAWPAVRTLSSMTGLSAKTVHRAISELVQNGFLSKEVRRGLSNLYSIASPDNLTDVLRSNLPTRPGQNDQRSVKNADQGGLILGVIGNSSSLTASKSKNSASKKTRSFDETSVDDFPPDYFRTREARQMFLRRKHEWEEIEQRISQGENLMVRGVER